MSSPTSLSQQNERKRKLALALLILESSSEDSSDDDLLQMLIKEKILRPKHAKRRSLLGSYSDEEFMKQFRMRRQTCSRLISDFQKSVYYPKNDSHGGTPKSSAENHVLSFLRFAGSKTNIKDVAAQFNIGESTFHRQMSRLMNYLVEIAPNVIKFPESHEQRLAMAKQFEELSGFPGVLGSLDSTYIPIRTPANKNKSSYVNHQQQISLTLQGICDPNGTFMDVFTGPPSRIHDAKVFRLSFVSSRLPELCLASDLHLAGDEAFQLSDYLMAPFQDPNGLSQSQINFNNRLQSAREPIREAFHSLKLRFKQLSRLDFHQVDTAAKFSLSCCVLHNLCVQAGDHLEELMLVDSSDSLLYEAPLDDEESSADHHQLGEDKRQRICAELWTKLGQTTSLL